MDIRKLTDNLSVAPQIFAHELETVQLAGFKSLICNRPDGEGNDQPNFSELEAAAAARGMAMRYLPAVSRKVTDAEGAQFGALLAELPSPVLAFCRTGMRSTTMWALSQAGQQPLPDILARATQAGYDLKGVVRRLVHGGKTPVDTADATHEVVIVGGGSAGIAAAASLLARSPGLDIAIIEPADTHDYQPGWTLVGAGVFDAPSTARSMASVLPQGVHWIKAAVAALEPEHNAVVLEGCRVVKYKQLIVCPMAGGAGADAKYDGYGSCPLTVERGKIVLAEGTDGGKLAPRFPQWLIDGTQPSALAWYLKERVLPPLYGQAMLKGREWLARPEMVG